MGYCNSNATVEQVGNLLHGGQNLCEFRTEAWERPEAGRS
jgi:hypothetical protein